MQWVDKLLHFFLGVFQQPNLIIVSKAGAYPSGSPIKSSSLPDRLLAVPTKIHQGYQMFPMTYDLAYLPGASVMK